MPLETACRTVFDRVAHLNERYRSHGPISVLTGALGDRTLGPVALASSFGADSVVLLHMISRIEPATPVLFVDTMMLFEQTVEYQRELARRLGLTDIRRVHPAPAAVAAGDPDGMLHARDPDACCALRKVVPLASALAGFGAWITGRKRCDSETRAGIDLFEAEGGRRIKINPLAGWCSEEVADYIAENGLPRHPLVARGYRSIGCAPCTSPVAAGEDVRAGRWRGRDKTECGIHFMDGVLVRGPLAPAVAERVEA